jgi:hypothetical protein
MSTSASAPLRLGFAAVLWLAACHSSRSCSAFGSFMMYAAASLSVTSWRPRGRGIGSSNTRDQGISPSAGLEQRLSRWTFSPPAALAFCRHPRYRSAACVVVERELPDNRPVVRLDPKGCAVLNYPHAIGSVGGWDTSPPEGFMRSLIDLNALSASAIKSFVSLRSFGPS